MLENPNKFPKCLAVGAAILVAVSCSAGDGTLVESAQSSVQSVMEPEADVCGSDGDSGLSTLRFVQVQTPMASGDVTVSSSMWRTYIEDYVRGSAALGGEKIESPDRLLVDQLSAGYSAGKLTEVPGVKEQVVVPEAAATLISESLREGSKVFLGVGDTAQVPDDYLSLTPSLDGGELRLRAEAPDGVAVVGAHSVISIADDGVETEGCPAPGGELLDAIDSARRPEVIQSLLSALENGSGNAVDAAWRSAADEAEQAKNSSEGRSRWVAADRLARSYSDPFLPEEVAAQLVGVSIELDDSVPQGARSESVMVCVNTSEAVVGCSATSSLASSEVDSLTGSTMLEHKASTESIPPLLAAAPRDATLELRLVQVPESEVGRNNAVDPKLFADAEVIATLKVTEAGDGTWVARP